MSWTFIPELSYFPRSKEKPWEVSGMLGPSPRSKLLPGCSGSKDKLWTVTSGLWALLQTKVPPEGVGVARGLIETVPWEWKAVRSMVVGAGVVVSQVPELTSVGWWLTCRGIQVAGTISWEAPVGPVLVPMARDKTYVKVHWAQNLFQGRSHRSGTPSKFSGGKSENIIASGPSFLPHIVVFIQWRLRVGQKGPSGPIWTNPSKQWAETTRWVP